MTISFDDQFRNIVGIETINACNARCPFCALFQGNSMLSRELRPSLTMSQSFFEEIIEELSGYRDKLGTVLLNMNGEPLQDPLFLERMAVIKAKGLGHKIDIQTNGQFLNERNARAILDAGVSRITLAFEGAQRRFMKRNGFDATTREC